MTVLVGRFLDLKRRRHQAQSCRFWCGYHHFRLHQGEELAFSGQWFCPRAHLATIDPALICLVRMLTSQLLFFEAGQLALHVSICVRKAPADLCCSFQQAAMSAAYCIVCVTAWSTIGCPNQWSIRRLALAGLRIFLRQSDVFRSEAACAASLRAAAALEDATQTSRAAPCLKTAAVAKISAGLGVVCESSRFR